MDLDAFQERAAIMEFDGGMSRFQAETAAAKEQGFQRWEALDAIKGRAVAGPRDQRSALARQPGANDLPGVQPTPAQENRPMFVGDGNG